MEGAWAGHLCPVWQLPGRGSTLLCRRGALGLTLPGEGRGRGCVERDTSFLLPLPGSGPTPSTHSLQTQSCRSPGHARACVSAAIALPACLHFAAGVAPEEAECCTGQLLGARWVMELSCHCLRQGTKQSLQIWALPALDPGAGRRSRPGPMKAAQEPFCSCCSHDGSFSDRLFGGSCPNVGLPCRNGQN